MTEDPKTGVFLSPQRWTELRALLEHEDATAKRIHEVLRGIREGAYPDGAIQDAAHSIDPFLIISLSALAWIEQDSEQMENLCLDFKQVFLDPHPAGVTPRSDLGKGSSILAGVLFLDFGSELLSQESLFAFRENLATMVRSIREVGLGNPHSVANNWWMITHGSCLLGCIALDGKEGSHGPIDLGELKSWAYSRFNAFCRFFGNAGLYHEGSGYINYTASILFPTALAVQRHLDPGFLQSFPQFRKSLSSILVSCAAIPSGNASDSTRSFGESLQWNDAGRQCVGLNPFLAGLHLAEDYQHGALRTVFDQLLGVNGRDDWFCPYHGLALTVALYPFAVISENPEDLLPHFTHDDRQGLGFWRNSWKPGMESIVGWYARTTHPGGHSHDDAASIRLISHGRTWIAGPGQNRQSAEYQSVFTHADPKQRPKPRPNCAITCLELSEHAGLVGIDTRNSLQAYSERYLSWTSEGPGFQIALLDLLDEHQDPPRSWNWNLSLPIDLDVQIHEDQAGFTAKDPELGSLYARFLLDKPDRLEKLQMPESKRTYSSGKTIHYPGDRIIQGSFASKKQASILVAMSIQSAYDVTPTLSLEENSIIRNQSTWATPFAPALLKSPELREKYPNSMKFPQQRI